MESSLGPGLLLKMQKTNIRTKGNDAWAVKCTAVMIRPRVGPWTTAQRWKPSSCELGSN